MLVRTGIYKSTNTWFLKVVLYLLHFPWYKSDAFILLYHYNTLFRYSYLGSAASLGRSRLKAIFFFFHKVLLFVKCDLNRHSELPCHFPSSYVRTRLIHYCYPNYRIKWHTSSHSRKSKWKIGKKWDTFNLFSLNSPPILINLL